ncbi:MAG: carboxymuconolactone decarboxylase family protein [Alphaproteobacteria bacterium]|nr:carboxymuconolactone decarboxylase family protein [Alphaproteobacteria bacterium]
MAHLGDDALPDGLFPPEQTAIVRYAQKSTRLERIDEETYSALARHFTAEQIVDICLTVGLSNMINRFHATFQTDLDAATTAEAERGDVIAGSCPIPRPKPPG